MEAYVGTAVLGCRPRFAEARSKALGSPGGRGAQLNNFFRPAPQPELPSGLLLAPNAGPAACRVFASRAVSVESIL